MWKCDASDVAGRSHGRDRKGRRDDHDDHEDDSNWMPSTKKSKPRPAPRTAVQQLPAEFYAAMEQAQAAQAAAAAAPAAYVPPYVPDEPIEEVAVERPRLVVRLTRPVASASTPAPSEQSTATLQDAKSEEPEDEMSEEQEEDDEDEEDMERSEEQHIIDDEDRYHPLGHSRRSSARLSLGSVEHSDDEHHHQAGAVMFELAGLPLLSSRQQLVDVDDDAMDEDQDDDDEFDLDKLLELATTGSPDLNNPSTSWCVC